MTITERELAAWDEEVQDDHDWGREMARLIAEVRRQREEYASLASVAMELRRKCDRLEEAARNSEPAQGEER